MPVLFALPEMAEKLYVYDVVQGGWEHEGRGLEVNMRHVSYHLAKDVLGKNFKDHVEIRTAIAPDSTQYALRLGRWADLSTSDIAPAPSDREVLKGITEKHKYTPEPFVAFMKASNILSGHMHDADHNSSRDEALSKRVSVARDAAAMLLLCADIQATQLDFDLEKSFSSRLHALRERFDIPQLH